MRPMALPLIRPWPPDLLDPAGSDYSLPRLAAQYLAAPLDGESLAQQAAAIWHLQAPLRVQLADQGMLDLLLQLELPLCRVLAQMERVGVAVDEAALVAFGQMLQGEIDRSSGEVYRYAGEEFNINSPKKLGQILFEQLELPHGKKTKTGYSTNAEVLEKLKGKHPIVAEILRYRMLTKLKSTYADGLLKVIASDGRIHTTFQNTVTATGRLSSTDPNLQNIPVRTELGSELRRMFVAQPGWVLVDADYSQIELRVLAHVADDKNMQAAFLSGEDFHTVTAAQVFGVPVEEVTPEMRRSAKAVNFGIVYGISDWALAEDLGVSVAEAKAYIEGYLARFAGVRAYRENIVAEGREKGYVTTLLGRRRPLPELHSKNFNIRTGAERMAFEYAHPGRGGGYYQGGDAPGGRGTAPTVAAGAACAADPRRTHRRVPALGGGAGHADRDGGDGPGYGAGRPPQGRGRRWARRGMRQNKWRSRR